MLQLFYNAESVFLAVNASLRRLNNVAVVYLVQVSLLSIGHPPNKRFNLFKKSDKKAVLGSKFCVLG